MAMIPIDKVVADDAAQPRVQMNLFTADEYAEAMKAGAEFPAVDVFHDGDVYWLADGFHRLRAAKQAGLVEIRANVKDGELRDAVLFSLGANARHGVRRETVDIKNAIKKMLNDPEWREWSDREIARQCATYGNMVLRVRKSICDNVADRKVKRAGTIYTMKAKGATLTPPQRQAVIDLGLTDKPEEIERIEKVKNVDEILDAIESGKADTVTRARREVEREKVVANLESIETQAVKELAGVFDVVVIDPPWPIQKIERDSVPSQSGLDYPTMTIDEIKSISIPAADDCHLWLWTTHKYLPVAFEVLKAWSLKYVCTFTWHKPGGFQPFELPQYNCEFALYARKGSPKFIDLKGFPVCFDAGRAGHSEKPELFYNMVRRVTAGRRADMFNRRSIEGFEGWGNESGI